jgi:hypothetical protein
LPLARFRRLLCFGVAFVSVLEPPIKDVLKTARAGAATGAQPGHQRLMIPSPPKETQIKSLNSEDACLILANEMNMSRF